MTKFKTVKDSAILPNRKEGDAGYDLFVSSITSTDSNTKKEKTVPADKDGYILRKGTIYMAQSGVSAQIDKNNFGLIKPRSGVSKNYGLSVFAGVVDSSYSGQIITIFMVEKNMRVKQGDRISQIIILPCEALPIVTDEPKKTSGDTAKTWTKREGNGFGSTGK